MEIKELVYFKLTAKATQSNLPPKLVQQQSINVISKLISLVQLIDIFF